MAPRLTLTSGP